ncbi:RSP_7527 family protein [Marinobacterium arenosum]|uniref:RSP_7527 family protein n=1 Tax=Marinobacterium arenosum TaxID=2862496 RepID=UPI001C940F2C|nr:hypothetical protein [Marinobacterium arenosum]MBY4676951.1 hypothetical protein [Marinobacterium arenosum]
MNREDYLIEIRTTVSGRVDMEYYIDQAQELRSEEMARLAKAAVTWLKGLIKIEPMPSLEAVYGR